MKLTVQTFMIKVLLEKINLFRVSYHKSFLLIILKIIVIMTMN